MALRTLLLLLLANIVAVDIYAQCEVSISASPMNSVCGDCVTLTAFGRGQGQQVFNENFNSGSPTGWAYTQQATYNNPCSHAGVDGTPHLWMGSNSAVPRAMETVGYNFSTATSGATVCFDMLFAEQGDPAPCEGPDEPLEGVYLQYSIDNGATWVTIHYFNPQGGHDASLINWNNWCFQLPAAAITSNTKIRWFQNADSGADYDHWGLDNVAIYFNDPTYVISLPNGGNYSFPQGSSGGSSPNLVCPRTTTSYYAVMTNGTNTCRDTVTVTVVNPTIEINAGNDTSICPNTCAVLNATAKVIKKPARVITFSNSEVKEVVGTPAIPIFNPVGQAKLEMNINVQDLNMTSIQPNSIAQVCMNLAMIPGFPGSNINGFRVRLICPDGSFITLVPANTATGQLYTNTCFVPAGPPITSGSSPYTNSYGPNQPFNNLVGCTANGVWKIELFSSITSFSLPVGFFYGWSITFNDPEINYPADITWSPTTNMTGANTLTPQVCPTGTTTYTLTATDTAGCVTVTDDVTVTIQPSCCNLAFTATTTNPTCAANTGTININVTQGTGPYTYVWTDGPTGATRSNLPSGTYTVRITDTGQPNCFRDSTFTLSAPGAPTISNITATPELCAGTNAGSISVTASGGTGGLTYTWSPSATGANPTNLAPGNYSVTVSDANGCSVTGTVNLPVGPQCCNLAFIATATQPTCGTANGAISINVSSGGGSYTYTWSPGVSTTASASNLAPGVYNITVNDIAQGCNRDTTITLNTSSAPNVNNTTTTNETCQGANDGTATLNVSGGTGAYTYNWNTTPPQNTVTATNLAPGCYSATITDALGCNAYAQVCITAGPNCCNLIYDIATTDPSCGQADGSILISNLGGSGNYGFSWSNAAVTQDLVNIGAGVYSVTITDNGQPNCQRDTTVTLSNPNAPVIDNITATAETCLGANDGTTDMTLSGGNPPYNIIWSNNQTTEDLANLTPGNYTVTVSDALGCQVTGFIAVPVGPNCCNLSFGLDIVQPSCGQNNGSIEVVNIVSTGATTFLWNTGQNTQIIAGLAAGAYSVTVTDNLQPNCQRDSTITLSNAGGPLVTNVVTTGETCAGAGDGTATLTVTGVGPIICDWGNGLIGLSVSNLAPGTYSVTITDGNGCVTTEAVSITPGPQCCSLTASATTTPASCGGTDGTITVTVDFTSGTAPFEYSLGSGAFGPSNAFTVAGGNYAVTVRDANGCDTTLQVTVAEANNTIVLSIQGTDPSCPGAADGTVEVIITGGTAPTTTGWSTGGNTNTISGLSAGTYSVTVTDQTNCSAFASITLTDPQPLTVNLGPDQEICDGDQVVLAAGNANTYLWSTGDTTQTLTVGVGGTYAVTITNNGGCTAIDTVVVDVSIPATVDAGEDTTIIQYESIIQLNGSVTGGNGGSILWTPDRYLSCDDCENPMLSPDSTTTYVLTYTSALGCVASDSVTITVEPGEYFAIVPNAFSPNADGNNDVLYVYYKGVKRLVFQVHNRWGEMVFQTDDKTKGWDGTFKGVPAQDGVYVWDVYVEFYNVKIPAQRSKGSVVLLK